VDWLDKTVQSQHRREYAGDAVGDLDLAVVRKENTLFRLIVVDLDAERALQRVSVVASTSIKRRLG
jgi:hypothetical protein